MAFQMPITIADAVDHVHTRKYLLPAIQREFVWDTSQIEALFDSILSGYPIGSFLFWSVSNESRQRYEFYEFVRDYHELHQRHNPKADVTGPQEITAVLDGQQRLTALYIGLRGSYASKIKWRRRTSDDAYPSKRLYVDLLGRPEEFGRNYDFRFLTEGEAANRDGGHWFQVGRILEFGTHHQVFQYLVQNGLGNDEEAGKVLFGLHQAITQSPLINYYLEQDQDFDKVLNVFIRVNSGGTPLSYSDLLLSVATAQWTSLDAREEINALVDELNHNGRFRFDKDFVLKSCLVLTDLGDSRLRVSNFNKTNTERMEQRWAEVAAALRVTVSLAMSFGFTGQTLTSANALIPIAYYLLKPGLSANYVMAAPYNEDRECIRQWLLACLLTGTFTGQPDTVLNAVRPIIGQSPTSFPAPQIATAMSGMNRPLRLTPEQIDGFLDTKYGQSQTFLILSLLYPWLDYQNLFHQDHIFPRSMFTRTRLARLGVPPEQFGFYLDNVDRLPNLQLLQGTPNQEKSDQPFHEWLAKNYTTLQEQNAYRELHYIPDTNLTPTSFGAFFNSRRELMGKQLLQIVGMLPAQDNPAEMGKTPGA